MVFRFAIALSLSSMLLFGCSSCKSSSPNDPIVSPTNISDEKQDGDAPAFPYFIPWWAKQK